MSTGRLRLRDSSFILARVDHSRPTTRQDSTHKGAFGVASTSPHIDEGPGEWSSREYKHGSTGEHRSRKASALRVFPNRACSASHQPASHEQTECRFRLDDFSFILYNLVEPEEKNKTRNGNTAVIIICDDIVLY